MFLFPKNEDFCKKNLNILYISYEYISYEYLKQVTFKQTNKQKNPESHYL